jgi:putative ABC transport system substrate-binding protein
MSTTVGSRILIWLGVLVAVVTVQACGAGSPQSGTSFTIGLVTNNPNGLRNVQGFVDGMAQLGYVEGDNVTYLYAGEPRSGTDLDRELEDFVTAGVDLVFTAGTPTGVAAFRILGGTAIPVVFGVIADPVAAGVMEDLSHPGGNMTGVKLGTDQGRRLELLLQIAPTVHQILVPYNPADSAPSGAVDQVSRFAEELGVELVLAEARTDADVTELLESPPKGIDAIFLVPDSTVNARLADIVHLAVSLRLPTSGPSTAQVEEGSLMTYGFIHERAGAQAARIADQVLRGTDPGDLPVEDAESFLAVNLAAAKEIGLEVTDAFLQQAEIILRPGDEEEGGG